MSTEDWKPGDVAIRTHTGDSTYEMRSFAVECRSTNHAAGLHWHHANGGWDPLVGHQTKYRRLLVIDPEDRETVELLHGLIDDAEHATHPDLSNFKCGSGSCRIDAMQAALRAMLTPPKPPCDAKVILGGVTQQCELLDGHEEPHSGAWLTWSLR